MWDYGMGVLNITEKLFSLGSFTVHPLEMINLRMALGSCYGPESWLSIHSEGWTFKYK